MSASASKKTRGFGRRLRSLREQRGLTQEGLAEAAGISRDAVARLELGVRSARLSTLERIQEALGVSMESLVGNADSTATPERSRLDGLLEHLTDEGIRLVLDLTIAVHEHERRGLSRRP